MSPEVTIALIASIPAGIAAVGAWRSNGYKELKSTVLRIEEKIDYTNERIDDHLEFHSKIKRGV